MKAQNLTRENLKGLIFPANMQGDMDRTYKWIDAGKPGRSRAAERVCGLFRASEPPPAPVVETAPVAEPITEPAPSPKADTVAPPAAAVAPAAEVSVAPDGTVTVRPSTPPPAPSAEPAVVAAPAPVGDLVAMANELRKIHSDWKGGPYVCGNAFKRMNQVADVLARHGF